VSRHLRSRTRQAQGSAACGRPWCSLRDHNRRCGCRARPARARAVWGQARSDRGDHGRAAPGPGGCGVNRSVRTRLAKLEDAGGPAMPAEFEGLLSALLTLRGERASSGRMPPRRATGDRDGTGLLNALASLSVLGRAAEATPESRCLLRGAVGVTKKRQRRRRECKKSNSDPKPS
jgi:hypothetical protein